MNFDTKDIEDFINGVLSKDKELLFEEKMQTDVIFSKEVADYQKIFSGFNVLKDEQKAKELILDWENGNEEKSITRPSINEQKSSTNTPVRKIRPFKVISVAASIMLLIGAFYWAGIRPYSDSAIYANFYNDKNTSTAIKSGDTSSHPFKIGYDAYAQGNYKEAINFFSTIPKSDSNYNTALYYLSHSYLQEKNWVSAIFSIEDLKSKNDIRYQEEAEWLAVLTHLRLGDKFNMVESLALILYKKDHAYYNKAKTIESDLNSFPRKTFF